MRDELIQPAFAIYNSPGVYALLLGSGISKPAEIPTGDDVMNDLIYQLAIALDKDIENPDADWYKTKFSKKPTYDLLLEQLGTDKSERQAILRPYFEPTEDEFEQGKKVPTKAHNAIAWLIKHKFIRVIVTTNFDRLLEKALSNIGIESQVVTENSITYMTPPQHADVTIIKIHGDYLEVNLKNTANELSDYPDSIKALLHRVFTEYGLLVCGWSGKTDKALRELLGMEQSQYSTYFASYTVPEDEARNLLQLRNAVKINGIGGDIFFTEIQQMIESLSGIQNTQKLSTAILVNRLKKLLANPNNQIAIEDIVRDELEAVIHNLSYDNVTFALDEISEKIWDKWKVYQASIQYYADTLDRLIQILFVISRYTDGRFSDLLARTIERTFELDQPTAFWNVTPAILLTYSVGIASTINKNWENISAIVKVPYIESDQNTPNSKAYICTLYDSFYKDFEGVSGRVDVGDSVFNVLQPYLKIYENSDTLLVRTYDLFEMLSALLYLKHNVSRNFESPILFFHYFDSRSWKYLEDFWKNVHNSKNEVVITVLFPDEDEKPVADLLERHYKVRNSVTSKKEFPKFHEIVKERSLGIW